MELQKVFVPVKEKQDGFAVLDDGRLECYVVETDAILLSKEDYDKIKDALTLIRSNIRNIIPTHVSIDSESDMALYHSFHASEQALQILNK